MAEENQASLMSVVSHELDAKGPIHVQTHAILAGLRGPSRRRDKLARVHSRKPHFVRTKW
jgi:hypothetical protein